MKAFSRTVPLLPLTLLSDWAYGSLNHRPVVEDGQIALPLLPVQAEQLIAIAERAPYGRGTATIVDTSVRRTWQIGPDHVRLGGKHWQGALDRIVALAAERLGIE